MKTCSKCGEEKFLTDFSKDRGKKDGLRTQCKVCRSKYQSKLWRSLSSKSRKHRKEYSRLRPYGLSKQQYEEMLSVQNGCCAICPKHLTYSHIDHCHTTNKVRGILCPKCNHGLGMFGDDPELMKKAIEYLIR